PAEGRIEQPLGRIGGVETRPAQPLQQAFGGDARLEAGQGRAKTEVHPGSESDVQVGLAPHIEAVRIDELAWVAVGGGEECEHLGTAGNGGAGDGDRLDRKSTRLNSSHLVISYAVFCL